MSDPDPKRRRRAAVRAAAALSDSPSKLNGTARHDAAQDEHPAQPERAAQDEPAAPPKRPVSAADTMEPAPKRLMHANALADSPPKLNGAVRAENALQPSRESLAPTPAADGAVVITGLVGRMGLLLARKLHRARPVIGIDRRQFEGKPEDIVHHQLDMRRRKTRDIFRAGGIAAAVHLGVMHNPRESDRVKHEWNVIGFQKLLEYVATYRVPKLVVLSSATLYGPNPDNPQFLTEDAPLLGAQEFSRIRDLVEVDMLAQSFFWKHPEVETVILRPCHILGRVRNAPSNYCRMARPLTVLGFDPMMQVIHERDVVEALALALRPGCRGIFNLRGPGELPLSRMLRLLGKRPVAVPSLLIRGAVGGMWTSRTTGFPAPELDHLRYVCMVDDTRARQELGFRPRYDMEQTLRSVYSER